MFGIRPESWPAYSTAGEPLLPAPVQASAMASEDAEPADGADGEGSAVDEERVALGISLGLSLGVAFGLLSENLGLGLSLGLAIGAALGLLWGQAGEGDLDVEG
jgi:hypothetical protein